MGVNPETFAHYMALQASSLYLPMEKLDDGCLYVIHARNSHVGCWCAKDRAFLLVREKHGRIALARESHWDSTPPGSAKPFVKLSAPVELAKVSAALADKLRELPYLKAMELTRPFTTDEGR
jgi:hypothetical protein